MPWQTETYWNRLIGPGRHSVAELALRAGLRGASFFYEAGVRSRNRAFDAGKAAVARVEASVISIGNLSVGGTGKTSLVVWCAQQILGEGKTCAILSRGYRRAEHSDEPRIVSNGRKVLGNPAAAGDEPLLIAKKTAAPVLVCADRASAARLAIQKFNPQVLLLDDGFQHRQLHRDLDVVCVDDALLEAPHLFPRGLLREPARNLSRAHFLVMKTALAPEDYLRRFSRLFGPVWKGPCAAFQYEPEALRSPSGGSDVDLEWLRGRKIVACSAIARPETFEALLKQSGARIVGTERFPDHYSWTAGEWDALKMRAKRLAAEIVVTEKDAVKLGHDEDAHVLSVRIRWTSGERTFADRVRACGL